MRRFIIAIEMLLIVVFIGTIGYTLIEKWSLFDSFYMTIITIGTVGFHEVAELSQSGRMFTIGLIIVGIVIVPWLFLERAKPNRLGMIVRLHWF
jgi:voltage-gated potassium channel